MYIVYKTTNLINKKIYIGLHRTQNLNDNYLGSGKYLKLAIKKYGRQNFSREILMICQTKLQANFYQIEFIKLFDAKRKGYNICDGGQGASKIMDLETRNKISKSVSGENNPFYGKRHSQQTKKIYFIGEANAFYGKRHSQQARKKISEGNKGKKRTQEYKKWLSSIKSGKNHHFYGQHLTAIHREKISYSISGSKHWNYGKSPSQETRKKMSQSHLGNKHYLYGKHLSEETKLKLSIGRLGQKHWNYGKSPSQETRKKISNSLKGKKMSEETKKKISNSRKGMVFTEQHKEKIRNSLKKRYQKNEGLNET